MKERSDWIRLVGGGFAHQTAPFAVHAFDERRANKYLYEAEEAGLTLIEALDHASAYLDSAISWPFDKDKELARLRNFYSSKHRR